MAVSFSLRAFTPADRSALADLALNSPDGGNIAFSPRFHVPADVVWASNEGYLAAVVAEVEGVQGIVGAARISRGTCQFEGDLLPYALLSSLMVHPDYRRQGIAEGLARWRIAQITPEISAHGVILADIQSGNTGSLANAKKWATQIGGHLLTCPVPMHSRPVKPLAGVTVRPATPEELPTIAQNLNTFYQDYNFYRPQTAESLQAWLAASPLETPIHHYWVAVNENGRILAGVGMTENPRLMTLQIDKVPLVIQIANLFLKIIPADNVLRSLQTDKLWFAEGQLEAAQYLWQTLRWEWRHQGSHLLCNYDPRSPIAAMLHIPKWMPTTSVQMALASAKPMGETRLIAPLI